MKTRRLYHRQKEDRHGKRLCAEGQDGRPHNQGIRKEANLFLEIRQNGLAENLGDGLLSKKLRCPSSLNNQWALMFGHIGALRSALRVETK